MSALALPLPYPLTAPEALRRGLTFYAPLTPGVGARPVRLRGITAPSAESVDAVGTYVDPTGGLVKQAMNGVLRIERKGALLERARTNSCLRSEDFSNATWVKSNLAVDADANTMPDGSSGTVNELRATAANGTIIQDLGVIASAAKTFSIWLKRKTGSGNIDLTLDGGTSWTTVSVTSEWKRFDVTQTLADPDVGIRIVTDTDEVLSWGAQLENAAAFPSSYIPTGAAGVARSADVLEYVFANNVNNAQGTCFIAFTPTFTGAPGSNSVLLDTGLFGGGGSGNSLLVYSQSSDGAYVYRVDSASVISANLVTTVTPVRGQTDIITVTWQTDEFIIYVNGVSLISDTSGATPVGNDSDFGLGCDAALGGQCQGNIAHAMIWDRVLAPGEIRGLSDTIQNWV